MNGLLAAFESDFAKFGLVPMGALIIAFIVNVASWHKKDMNRKSLVAASLLFIALFIASATWTVRAFHGGSQIGAFWAVVAAAGVHCVSAVIALLAIHEHRTIGRWPHGRRRASWGFWLNVLALFVITAWFWLGVNPIVYQRIFE
jgi:hypothetical protein